MAISVPCAKCATKLVAPDSAVGRQLRCPRCGTLTTVPDLLPAEEVAVVEATVTRPPSPPPPPPPAAKPAPVRAEAVDEPRSKKSRRDEDDADDPPRKKKRRYADDDDDYEHDHPRRKSRRRAAGGGGGALVAVLVIGGLVVLGGACLAIYLFVGRGKDKDSDSVRRTLVPPGWKQFSYPNDGFKAYFPNEPQVVMNQAPPWRGGGGGFAMDDDLRDVQSVSSYMTGFGGFGGDQPVVMVAVARYRNGVPRSVRNKMDDITETRMGNIESRRVRWLGRDAGEVVMGGVVMRIVCTDNALIMVQVHGPNGNRAKPEEEAGFFDNFELIK